MPDDFSPSTRYRRLARECLEIAQTFPAGERRTVLLQMAQVWQRLADEYADSSAPLLRPLEGEQPVMQQQQQAQPRGHRQPHGLRRHDRGVSRVFQIARQRSFDPGAGIRLSRPQARRPLVPLCAPLAGSSRSRPSAARGLARHARRRVEPLLARRSQTFRGGPRLRPAAFAPMWLENATRSNPSNSRPLWRAASVHQTQTNVR